MAGLRKAGVVVRLNVDVHNVLNEFHDRCVVLGYLPEYAGVA